MKKFFLIIFAFILFIPGISIAKPKKTFKVYLLVTADDLHKDSIADFLRTELRKNDDVVFTDFEKAQYILGVEFVQNEGGIIGMHAQVVEKSKVPLLYYFPMGSTIVISGHLNELESSMVASINENVFEPLREANP